MTVRSSVCERVVLAGGAAASVSWSSGALPGSSGCGGVVSASGRALPGSGGLEGVVSAPGRALPSLVAAGSSAGAPTLVGVGPST